MPVQESLRALKSPAFCVALTLLLPLPQLIAQESLATPSSTVDLRTVQPAETPPPQPAQHASDLLTYWYGTNYHTPFVFKSATGRAADITRHSIEYSHAGRTGILSSFADVTLSQSDMSEPAASGGTGATEVYAILRPGVSLNALSHSSTFRKGPLRDITFEAGANLETKNSSYAPAERTLYIGPALQFALPRGYLNVGLHARKEWNHEGVLGKSENYDPGFNIEPNWMISFAFGRAHLAWSGFAEYNTAKGKDSFGSETVGEFLLRNSLGIDIGSPLFHRGQLVELRGGFWYWHNEYGKRSSAPGAEQMAPIFGITFHLDGGRPVRRQ